MGAAQDHPGSILRASQEPPRRRLGCEPLESFLGASGSIAGVCTQTPRNLLGWKFLGVSGTHSGNFPTVSEVGNLLGTSWKPPRRIPGAPCLEACNLFSYGWQLVALMHLLINFGQFAGIGGRGESPEKIPIRHNIIKPVT